MIYIRDMYVPSFLSISVIKKKKKNLYFILLPHTFIFKTIYIWVTTILSTGT